MYEIVVTTVAKMTMMLEKPLPWQPTAEHWTFVRVAHDSRSVRAVAVEWCATLTDMEGDVVGEPLWKAYDLHFVACFGDMVYVMLTIFFTDPGFFGGALPPQLLFPDHRAGH